jgi:hypothetical protein
MERQTDFQPKHDAPKLFAMDFSERRKLPRCDAKDGVISIAGVHVNPATTRLLNINRQGLAFEHISPHPLPDTILDINLLVVDEKKRRDLFFHMAKAEILSIAAVHGSWGKRGGSSRRYGLRFVGLTPQQQYSLVQFLGDKSTFGNMLWQEEIATN